MTALVITTILAAAAIPTYKAYVNKASLAEATTVISVMERNQIKYFTENGSFISAAPNPAQVPGIATEQDNAFGTSTQWAELGFPVTPGTQVLFSYQAFAGQTEKDSTTPVENDNLFNPNDDMDLQRTGRYTSSIQPAQMKYYALHADDFQFDFGNFGWNACAKGEDPNQACIDACRGDARCEAECEEEEEGGDQMSNCQSGCVEVYGGSNSDGCARRCEVSGDGTCGGYAWDYDCYSGDHGGDKCISNCRGDLSCVKRCDSGAESVACLTMVGGALSGCAYSGGGGLGGGGGEEPPAEEEEDEEQVAQENEEEEEENEDGVGGGGDAGGMEMGDNEDEDGETTIAENTCADFGVSRPIHFGIQEGVQDYNWVVNTGVTSRSKDPECWLVVRVTQVINGDITTSAPIQINEGK